MIVEFSCKETGDVWNGRICKIALRKIFMLNAAHKLEDLRISPSNRLLALKGKLKDHHSISINMPWRIIFIWNDRQVKGVKITDYH